MEEFFENYSQTETQAALGLLLLADPKASPKNLRDWSSDPIDPFESYDENEVDDFPEEYGDLDLSCEETVDICVEVDVPAFKEVEPEPVDICVDVDIPDFAKYSGEEEGEEEEDDSSEEDATEEGSDDDDDDDEETDEADSSVDEDSDDDNYDEELPVEEDSGEEYSHEKDFGQGDSEEEDTREEELREENSAQEDFAAQDVSAAQEDSKEEDISFDDVYVKDYYHMNHSYVPDNDSFLNDTYQDDSGERRLYDDNTHDSDSEQEEYQDQYDSYSGYEEEEEDEVEEYTNDADDHPEFRKVISKDTLETMIKRMTTVALYDHRNSSWDMNDEDNCVRERLEPFVDEHEVNDIYVEYHFAMKRIYPSAEDRDEGQQFNRVRNNTASRLSRIRYRNAAKNMRIETYSLCKENKAIRMQNAVLISYLECLHKKLKLDSMDFNRPVKQLINDINLNLDEINSQSYLVPQFDEPDSSTIECFDYPM